MIMQIYLLTVLYLLFGAGLLLVDHYGGRLLILIRMRNSFRTSWKTQVGFIVAGLVLCSLKLAIPVSPGPVLFGDLFPAVMALVLAVHSLSKLVEYRKRGKDALTLENQRFEEAVLQRTGTLIESNKRHLGALMAACAALHFLFPHAVLL